MRTYVALLRGVNVGGTNKLPMRELVALFASLGYQDATTYIQSGNVVFKATTRREPDLALAIESGVADTFGLTVRVVVRTAAALEDVVARNPFHTTGADLSKLFVFFLAHLVAPTAELDPHRSPPDQFAVSGREIYVLCPNGLGQSKLTVDYFERRLNTTATARNWNTVTKLLELARP